MAWTLYMYIHIWKPLPKELTDIIGSGAFVIVYFLFQYQKGALNSLFYQTTMLIRA